MITDRLLRSWIRCNRKAWLDRYGDNKNQLWTAHRSLQLDHQQKSFVALIPNKPGKGITACEKGFEGIIGLRLKGRGPSGELLEAHPPLLQRTEGESRWGEYAYRPVISRQGRKLTRDHKLTLSLFGLLLEQLQKAPVPLGIVISKVSTGLEIETVSLYKQSLRSQLREVLIKLSSDLKSNKPPPLTSDRRKCSLCCWRGLCNLEAAQQEDLGEVSGIGSKRKKILHELGIKKIHELANTNPITLSNSLEAFGEQHRQIAHQLVSQAKAQHSGLKERLKFSSSLPELIHAPGVLLYDIESDPDARDDFLHGFICLYRRTNGLWDLKRARYQPILALYEHGSELCWRRLKRKLNFYKDWPVLHYGETEAISLLRLAKQQGVKKKDLDKLSHRLINVHERLRMHWRLPVNSYGLKTVANWTGFQWEKQGADGARALLWWRQWRGEGIGARGSSNSLKLLLRYNQDDCLATWAVTEWLVKQDKHFPKLIPNSPQEN